MNLKIRQEQSADHRQIYALVQSAFACAGHTNGREQDLVEALRKSPAFVPQLSLVADVEGELVGYLLLTEIQVGSTTQLLLAPLAVAPRWQRQGIGGKLIVEGHRIARELGYEFAVLVGHADYYPRFGYVDAALFGIRTAAALPPHVFLAVNLQGRETKLNANLHFPPEFTPT